jgi:flagellar motor switch protein FliM
VQQLGCRKKHKQRVFQAREVVKSSMRVLYGREQVTLSRLLKLTKGDVVKFVREIRMYDDEDWKRVVKGKSVSS